MTDIKDENIVEKDVEQNNASEQENKEKKKPFEKFKEEFDKLEDSPFKEFYQNNLNKSFDGIVETRKDNKKIVLTTNYIPVEIEDNLENNTKVNIQITEVTNDQIKGELLK